MRIKIKDRNALNETTVHSKIVSFLEYKLLFIVNVSESVESGIVMSLLYIRELLLIHRTPFYPHIKRFFNGKGGTKELMETEVQHVSAVTESVCSPPVIHVGTDCSL